MAKLNGNDYIVFVDTTTSTEASRGASYVPVMCMTSNGFSMTRETIDVPIDKCSALGFSTPMPGTASWSITGSGNAIDETGSPSEVSYQELFEICKTGEPIWVKIANRTPGTGAAYIREGVAILTDISETQDTNTPFTFDFTFTGVGEPLGAQTT